MRVQLRALIAAALISSPCALAIAGSERAETAQPSSSPVKPSDTRLRAEFWKQRSARSAHDPLARVQAGKALLQLARETGDHALNKDAERYFRAALELGSENPAALAALAFALNAQHRFRAAVEVAARARAIDPHDDTALAALGDAEFELGNLDAVRAAYRHLLDDDRSLFALTRWANLELAEGNANGAIESLLEAAETGERRGLGAFEIARCLVLAGDLHFQRGRFRSAEPLYTRALTLWPNGYLTLEHLGELRAAQGALEESGSLYARVVEIAPQPDLLEAYSKVERALGHTRRADELLKQALEGYRRSTDGGDPSYYRHLALLLADTGHAGESIAWARRDLELRPTAEAWAVLGWAQHQAGDHTAAERSMDTALASSAVLGPEWLYRAGMIYQRAGKSGRAEKMLRRALDERGAHPDAVSIRKALLQLKG